MITSLLDTDLYKFTMMQAVLHQYPGAQVEYQFKCRNEGVDLAQFASEIEAHIKALCGLRFSKDELDYLRSLRFIKSDFIDFLDLFHLQPQYIKLVPQADGRLDLRIQGPWLHTILFEIPLLAIINEVYFKHTVGAVPHAAGLARLNQKIDLIRHDASLSELKIADYGTRRRFSKEWHSTVLDTLKANLKDQFAGTSNVRLAMEKNLIPLGTMAHEYLQAFQALSRACAIRKLRRLKAGRGNTAVILALPCQMFTA